MNKNLERVMDAINRETTPPDKMSKLEAWDFLLEVQSLINGNLDALDSEMMNEEEEQNG